MKQISKEQAEKLITRSELTTKILIKLIWLPIALIIWLFSKIVLSLWPFLTSRVIPEIPKELLIQLIVLSIVINLSLLALCILLILQLRKKPIKEIIDMRDDKYFKM